MAKVKLLDEKTICAISTPKGEGGIHIVRLSGKDALKIALKIFKFKNTKLNTKTLSPNMIHYGDVIDLQQKAVDEGLLAYFKGPFSYTREDVVEINVHGNFVIAHKVLKLMLDAGARLAEEGEFTKRAFLNGRLDLAQAEAVFQMISAKTELSYEVAFNQLQGSVSEQIHQLKDLVIEILAEVEAFVDFPDEDIEVYTSTKLNEKLQETSGLIDSMLQTYKNGEVLREGIYTVIIGKPNVGKSSLMNTLLKRDRAIVSDVPGTTRDSLEELLDISGVLFRIVDTAGMREGNDPIEKLGIERTKNYIQQGQLFVCLLDGSRALDQEDLAVLDQVKDRKTIYVLNKVDLPLEVDKKKLEEKIGQRIVMLSTESREGVESLEKELVDFVWQGDVDSEQVILSSQRQYEALVRARESVLKAQRSFRDKMSLEFFAFDLRETLEALSEVVGEVCSDDILGVIFSKFCIGK